jgi:PKD repeat protein
MFLFALTLLTACGGGGGGGSDSSGGTSVNTGTFIDAPVQGLGYQTATQHGTTDNQASFRCEAGEQITFYIGDDIEDVVLGTAPCKTIITPLDLVPDARDETDPTVTNILRLLQSLDDDCDLDNTIHITPQIASIVSDHPIDFNTSVEDFNNGVVADLFDALNGLGAFTCETPRELKSAEEAQEHFRLVLEEHLDPEELTAFFTLSPETLIVFEPVIFDASESTGNITEYIWDFGDGQTGSSVEVSHTYSTAGTYLTTLTVNGEKNAVASSTQEIVVNVPPNQPPIASFTPNPTSGTAPQLISFVPTASDPDGTIIRYFWDFGDGASIKGRVAKRTYKQPGIYLVTLTVTDDDGAETIVSEEVVITGPSANQAPIASFTATPEAGEAPLQVSFNGTGSSDPDGTIASYIWNFGDGRADSGVIENHTFQNAGRYQVILTVTDNDGATDIETTEIIVSEPAIDCSTNPCDDNATCDDSGAEIICTCNSGWTGNGFSCSEIECENNDTLPNGGSACGLNNRGEFGQRCVDGLWQNNPGTCIDPDVCSDDSFTDGAGACGFNDNGTLMQECVAGQWTDSDECDDPDVCTNDDTLANGGAACGLNNRGEFAQRCVDGAWQNNTDVCSDLDVCTDDSVTDGSTVCGFNDNGTLMQECVTGQWTDSDDCDDPDVCVNDTIKKGPTECSGGHYMQVCESGQWSDTTDCILDEDDEDGDLVNAGDDPNDSDNTICGDSDSDGCDDCSVAGIFDPANDGWDENGDGNCELPLDYDCMNGANAAIDPYRLQACIQFTYVNQDRALFAAESDNAAPLEWNEDIWEVAVAHSIDMCTRKFFSHWTLPGHSTLPSNANPGQRLAAAGLFFGWSENIAINHDPGAAQYAFMEEPTCVGHRANVLEPRAIEVGIGYHLCENAANTEWNGAQFVTQDFRLDSGISPSAYCQNSANVCQIPPNPPTTAPCPASLIAWGFCPVPSVDTLQGWGCN